MPDEVNGSGGIPREGREVEYATELWLADPAAFFLHPEGPLSDTTPGEWRAKQAEAKAAERERRDAEARLRVQRQQAWIQAQMNANALQYASQYQTGLLNQQRQYDGLGQLLGLRHF